MRNDELRRRFLAVSAAAISAFLWATSVSAATPEVICKSRKLSATGKLVSSLLGCDSKATKQGEPIDGACGKLGNIDRFDLWRGGTHAVRIEASGAIHVETVAATLGDRPWVLEQMREALRKGRLIDEADLTDEEESNDSAAETSGDEE